MELMTLDANFQPAKLVENYDSLVWSERYNTVGDFQLITGDVSRFMTLLPRGTVISLRESTVPMIVESHRIDRKKASAAVLTITGRSFESILDRRASVWAVNGGTAVEWTMMANSPSDLAWQVIIAVCVNGTASPLDIFPTSKIQFPMPADFGAGVSTEYKVPAGQLLQTVLQLLQTKADDPSYPIVEHGIRCVRPGPSASYIGCEIYVGQDRSNQILFDGSRGLLNDGSYLFSEVGSATTAYLLGGNATNLGVILNKTGTPASGFDRRVILVDASSSNLAADDTLIAYGEAALTNASTTAIFDGSINADVSPYTYGVDYQLGDVVRLIGDYGLDRQARVTEYIRTSDATGNKQYPTLVSL